MEGPLKTVCFISTFVITWGLFQVGEAIIAWFDYQISGTEIPWNLEIVGHPLSSISKHPDKVDHINSILIHILFLIGIVTETTRPMFVWTVLYNIFIFVGSIYSVMVGFRGLFNLFLPQFFEMRSADWKWICIYLAIRIYGLLFEDVYKFIKKKEIAKANEMMDENANFEEGKKTKEGEKLTFSDRDPVKSAMSDEVYILVHVLLFSFSYLQIYSLIY